MLFIPNKYTKWYNSIISRNVGRPKTQGSERHHIIPIRLYADNPRGKSGHLAGNPNSEDNLVYLTYKEHRLCHLLLPKMLIDPIYILAMHRAIVFMESGVNGRNTSKGTLYEISKEKSSASRRGVPNPGASKAHTGRISPTKGMIAWNRGIPMTESAKLKASNSLKGKPTWNKGHKFPIASCIRCRKTGSVVHMKTKHFENCTWQPKGPMYNKGIPATVVECPHCGKRGGQAIMRRWHFDNCRYLD